MLEALHCNVFLLSVLFPTNVIEVSCDPSMIAMLVDPRYQVMTGAGNALLLTLHWTSISLQSLIVSGLSLGTKETLWTSTKKNQYLIYNSLFKRFHDYQKEAFVLKDK